MRKLKMGMVCLITTLPLMVCMGCGDNLRMNTDKCAEVALEYLESKYQTEFEVVDSSQRMQVYGPAGYAQVTVRNKSEDNENEYIVTVYPDDLSDEDKDGEYDSYKVVSDTYMCYLLQGYARNEMDNLLMEAGLTRFISSVGLEEHGGIAGFWGFATDFPIQSEETFSFKDILYNRIITIDCWIKIPKSEYSDMLQNNITNIIQPLLTSDDLVTITINVYNDEYYSEIEEYRKNNIKYSAGRGEKSIYFSIEEEDEDESK